MDPSQIVPEKHAGVVFRIRRCHRRKAPLHVKGEIRELAIEAQPLVAAVAVAHNLLFRVIDMPLRHLAHGMVGRNGHARPDFRSPLPGFAGKKFAWLRRRGQRQSEHARQDNAATRAAIWQKRRFMGDSFTIGADFFVKAIGRNCSTRAIARSAASPSSARWPSPQTG